MFQQKSEKNSYYFRKQNYRYLWSNEGNLIYNLLWISKWDQEYGLKLDTFFEL